MHLSAWWRRLRIRVRKWQRSIETRFLWLRHRTLDHLKNRSYERKETRRVLRRFSEIVEGMHVWPLEMGFTAITKLNMAIVTSLILVDGDLTRASASQSRHQFFSNDELQWICRTSSHCEAAHQDSNHFQLLEKLLTIGLEICSSPGTNLSKRSRNDISHNHLTNFLLSRS